MLASQKTPRKRPETKEPGAHEDCIGCRSTTITYSYKSVCGLEDLGAPIKSGEYDREDVPVQDREERVSRASAPKTRKRRENPSVHRCEGVSHPEEVVVEVQADLALGK